MLEGDEVLRGRLMHSQTLIVLESMSSTRLIPAIRSLGVCGWDSDDRSVAFDDEAGGWSGGF
jgi:hypothetical protein